MTFPWQQQEQEFQFILLFLISLSLGGHFAPIPSFLESLHLERSLNLTQNLLIKANSSYAANCWMCLSMSSSAYSALPVPSSDTYLLPTTLVYRVQKGATFFERADTLLGDYPTSATNRANRLYHTYYSHLEELKPSTPPAQGPVTLNTPLLSPAPLCFTAQGSIPVGYLPSELCNTTVNIQFPQKHQNSQVNYQVSPEANGLFTNPVRFTEPPILMASQHKCSYPTGRLHPWLTTSSLKLLCAKQSSTHISPLVGAALSSTLTAWSSETVGQSRPLTHLFSLHLSACITQSGAFYMCGTNTYMCLPTNWTGTCTLVYLTPNINLVPPHEPLPVPSTLLVKQKSRRAVQVIPLLAALGITTAVGLGAGGLGTSLSYFHSLSEDLQNSLEEIASTLVRLQDQLDSLAAVTLQNRRGLDLLTAEKGGICVFLEEECCFYLNQSGLVRDAATKLKEQAQPIRERQEESWNQWLHTNWVPWLLPFIGPLTLMFVVLAFGSCLLRLFSNFLQDCLKAFTN